MMDASIPNKKLKSGFTLPALGLGTWMMGGDVQRIESAQDKIDINAIQSAIDMGYRHIDTAELYGNGHAEEIIAEALTPYKREDVFIATKAKHNNHDKKTLPTAIENSLKRLKTDFIDLYYLHRPTLETSFEETAEILNKFYADGKIKNIGVCNFSIQSFDQLQRHLKMKIIANQVHYNLAFREPETSGLLDHATKNDYFIIGWRPLRLVKRNENNPMVDRNIWEEGAFPLLDELAKKYQKTNVQVALNWIARRPNVCTIIKSSKQKHLSEAKGYFFEMDEDDDKNLTDHFSPQYPVSDTIPLI